MTYQDYIDLGFERIDLNDNDEFKKTGYYGFYLSRKFKNGVSIDVYSYELERPKVYIPKSKDETFHIITITPEILKDTLKLLNI